MRLVLAMLVLVVAGGGLGTVRADDPTPADSLPDDALRITVLYDNYVFDDSLQSGWGFSALLEFQGHTVLFDTGGSILALAENLESLEIDPAAIDAVVLSHIHQDHTGGLSAVLTGDATPTVYVLPSFPSSFTSLVARKTEVITVEPGLEIAPGIRTTGELSGPENEQALFIETAGGLVVITGCAHPGVVQMVAQARTLAVADDESADDSDAAAPPVLLVLGGFHLGDASESRIQGIIEDFRAMGVQQVAPTHCTGDEAIAQFQEAYGDAFIPAGVGRVIVIAPADVPEDSSGAVLDDPPAGTADDVSDAPPGSVPEPESDDASGDNSAVG
jgi:7,8-dihydropterin-6-yl-methyl-4-(beta-D-ribofuranosyl)aminobenzene 5'-phosphate synthase